MKIRRSRVDVAGHSSPSGPLETCHNRLIFALNDHI